MPYYGSYPMGLYQPIQNQYQPMQMNQPAQAVPPAQPSQQMGNGIIWCQGEEGAKGYLVAPGNSVLLMDSENSTFYIKSTDASGMPQPLRIFDYTERTEQRPTMQAAKSAGIEYAPLSRLEALEARMDALAASREPAREPVARAAAKRNTGKEETSHE